MQVTTPTLLATEGAKPDRAKRKRVENPMWQAHRLEGKVKNMGIKNKGRQLRKIHQGK